MFSDNEILFIGSSSIRLWELDQYFPDYNGLNRGFGGAHISDMLYFIDIIVNPYSIKAVVFYCGDNDIASGKTPERVFNDLFIFMTKLFVFFLGLNFIISRSNLA